MVRMIREGPSPRGTGWSIAPRLVHGAPPAALVVVGALALLVGLLIVTRPSSPLFLLTVYVGLSAIFTGVARMLGAPESAVWSRVGFGALWIALGLAILVGLGRTLELLPQLIAVLLLVGGLASLYDAFTRGRVSQRVLAAAGAGAQLVFGILAFSWPDVTVLVVAIVFGVRTIVFGATLVVRAVQRVRRGRARRARGRRRALRRWREGNGCHDRGGRPRPHPQRLGGGWAVRSRGSARGARGRRLVGELVAVGGCTRRGRLLRSAAVVPYEHGRLIRVGEFAGQEPVGAQVHAHPVHHA